MCSKEFIKKKFGQSVAVAAAVLATLLFSSVISAAAIGGSGPVLPDLVAEHVETESRNFATPSSHDQSHRFRVTNDALVNLGKVTDKIYVQLANNDLVSVRDQRVWVRVYNANGKAISNRVSYLTDSGDGHLEFIIHEDLARGAYAEFSVRYNHNLYQCGDDVAFDGLSVVADVQNSVRERNENNNSAKSWSPIRLCDL